MNDPLLNETSATTRGERDADESVDGARDSQPGTLLQRWLWFGGLWLAGVATVSAVAYGIRAMILP